jgi:hypothetical protein
MTRWLIVTAILFSFQGRVWSQSAPDTPEPPPKTYLEKRRALRIFVDVDAGSEEPKNLLPAFSSIPASFRQVPGHPDDAWKNQIFTIPDDSILFSEKSGGRKRTLNTYQLGTGLTFWDLVALKGGFLFSGYGVSNYIGPSVDSTNIREMNQSNNPGTSPPVRGYGTSLVYYAVMPDGTGKTTVPFLEGEIRVYRWISLYGGGWKMTPIKYEVEHGYDRYDALATLRRVPFAEQHLRYRYGGIKMEFQLIPERFAVAVRFHVGKLHQSMSFVPGAESTQTGLPKDNIIWGASMSPRFYIFNK